MSSKEAELKAQARVNEPYFARPQTEFEPKLVQRSAEELAADQALLEKLEEQHAMGALEDGGNINALVALLGRNAADIRDLRRRLNWTLLAVSILTIWQLLSWMR